MLNYLKIIIYDILDKIAIVKQDKPCGCPKQNNATHENLGHPRGAPLQIQLLTIMFF